MRCQPSAFCRELLSGSGAHVGGAAIVDNQRGIGRVEAIGLGARQLEIGGQLASYPSALAGQRMYHR
jgi:hypothetical protein